MTSPTKAEIDGLPALVVLSGGWKPEYADIIRSDQLTALSIRVTDGDISFLRGLPELRGLVLNASEVHDLTILQELRHLRTLTLNTLKKRRQPLDFRVFRALRFVSLYWGPGYESLFACRQLERLFVFGPPDTDFSRFAAIDSLRRFEVSEGRKLRTTEGIERLPALEFLGLYYQTGLETLAGVGDVQTLRELAIETCKKLTTLDELAELNGLRTLKIANCGEIESLTPLAGLRELERFFAWESTNITDGDLSMLMDLPSLHEVAMMSRRHYRPTVREVERALAERGH
jgi:Leucine-rich repeat (LRR) protein